MRRLAARRTGAGPRPVVLLHGLLGSGRNLSTLARGLQEHGRDTVTLDLTGHGTSPPLPPAADVGTLAGDVLDTLEALGLPGALPLVGHSLGGRVALRAAWLAPARVASLTLLDVAPGPLPAGGEVGRVLEILLAAPATFASRAEARAALVSAGLTPALADWLGLSLEPAGGAYRWMVDRPALAALHARMVVEDLWPVIEAPRAWRLTCVRGDAGHVGERDARRLQAAGGAVVTVTDAGHFLHVERPRPVLEAVLASLV